MTALPALPEVTRHRTAALATLVSLILIAAWEASALDLWLAAQMADAAGFPARHHWLLTRVLHDGARLAAGLMLTGLAVMAVRPVGVFRTLSAGRRLWLLAAVAGGMILVASLKRFSLTDCPWDVAGLGGQLPFVAHWQWGQTSGGPGHCFPAGHASAGFAWIAGWFAWPAASRTGRRWLAGALIAGLVLGVAQQLRGAHFMSHTLWTAWICWTWSWGLSALRPRDDDAPAAG